MEGVVTVLLVSVLFCPQEVVSERSKTGSLQRDTSETTQCWPNMDTVQCHNQASYIDIRYTASITNNSLTLAIVQLGLNRSEGLDTKTVLFRKLPGNISDLENFFCGNCHREGFLCANCKENCGISIYTYYGLPCSCPCHSYGIPLYLLLELGFSTLFFAVVFSLKCSAHSSRWIGYIFYFQITANIISLNPLVFTTVSKAGKRLPYVLLTLYGIWNMDFLRLIIPPFCVSSRANILVAVSTGYIGALWPLLLIILTSLSMELHKRNYKVTMYPWKLAKKISFGKIQRYFSDTNLVHTFATFLFLSYLKFISTSSSLLEIVHAYVFVQNGTHLSRVQKLSADPDIPYLGRHHIHYAITAFIILVILGIVLPVALILYPTRLGSHLNCASETTGRRWQAVKTFIEAFQGSYKDGTKGDRDYRAVSGAYLLIRVLGGLLFAFINSKTTTNYSNTALTAAGAAMLTAAFFGLAKPYKIARHNLIDVLLNCLLSVQCLYLYFIYSLWSYERSMVQTVAWLCFLPMIFAIAAACKPHVTNILTWTANKILQIL